MLIHSEITLLPICIEQDVLSPQKNVHLKYMLSGRNIIYYRLRYLVNPRATNIIRSILI